MDYSYSAIYFVKMNIDTGSVGCNTLVYVVHFYFESLPLKIPSSLVTPLLYHPIVSLYLSTSNIAILQALSLVCHLFSNFPAQERICHDVKSTIDKYNIKGSHRSKTSILQINRLIVKFKLLSLNS
jgi:hypothetical protein